MYIVDVSPISRGIPFTVLSYYAKERLQVGRLVTITVRNRNTFGVVIGCDPVSARKGMLKTARFETKPIKTIHTASLSPALVSAVLETTMWYRAELPDVLDAILPNDWLKTVSAQENLEDVSKSTEMSQIGFFGSMEGQEERIRVEIAAAISTRMPIAIICPTTHQCERWATLLDDHNPIVISSAVSEKKRIARMGDLCQRSNTLHILITTPNNLGMVSYVADKMIVIDESHPTYRDHPNGPFDFRMIIRKYAELGNIPLLWTGFAPSSDLIRELGDKGLSYTKVLDAKEAQKRIHLDSLTERESISTESKSFLRAIEKKGRVLVIAARKGFSSITVCQDCETVVTCPTCGTGLTLMNAKAEPGTRVFSCRHCRTRVAAIDQCASCNSWKLVPRGYGIERMAEIIEKTLGAGTVAAITNEEKLTRAGKALIKQWQEGSVLVLVTTPGLLDMADTLEPVTTIIASVQSLRAGPSLRQNENLARLFSVAESYTTGAVHYFHLSPCRLQEYLTDGNGESFAASEFRERKLLGLPPETVAWQLVGVSHELPSKTDIARSIGHLFPDGSPKITLANKPVRGAFQITVTVTISHETWSKRIKKDFVNPAIPGITWQSARVQPEAL